MKNKYFLSSLIVLVVVGGIAIKNSMTAYHYSTPASKLKSVYKEDINNIDFVESNSEINKKEQLSTTSKIKKTNNSKNNNKTTNPVLKSTDTNNSQIEDKKSSVNIVSASSINVEQNVKPNKVQEVSFPTETPKTTKRVDEVTTTNSASKANLPTIHYDRTTSIYDDDKITLLRVEYYSNNKLIYYSDVEQFDVATNSYTEKIYQWNTEKNIEILIRTDIYSNGRLVNSY